jgi:hypothetical protein
MPGTAVNAELLMLGRGKLFIDRLTSAGARTGEYFVGDVSQFEITPTKESIEHHSSATAGAPLMKEAVIRTALELRIVGHEFSPENVARALYGETATLSQTGDSVVSEVVSAVQQGYYYPVDYRAITSVVVKDDTDTTTYAVGTDYSVDATEGRLYIIPGGGITNDDDLHVSYDYSTIALNVVNGMTTTAVECYMRFVGDPAEGPTKTVEVWKASVASDGAISYIGDDFAEWTLTGKVQTDATNHPTCPHYREIEVSA